MLTYDVPFLPDPAYVDFLASRGHVVRSVHFSLHTPLVADARFPAERFDPDFLAELLARLPDTKKYALCNSRFHHPDATIDPDALTGLARLLDRLLRRCVLHGVVYADQFHLQALSDAAPETASRLEAVPSVNCLIDSAPRADAHLRFIARTRFKRPGKLILDRSLNREPERLAKASRDIRRSHPDMLLELLANEGCLAHCPYKLAHDSHISFANMPGQRERGFDLCSRLGCLRHAHEDPALILASPFIRPEDQARYEGEVDGLKLCGRTRGPEFMRRVVDSYFQGSYAGNLLDLLDALGELAGVLDIPNHELGEDFFARTAMCSGLCGECGACSELVRRVAIKRPLMEAVANGKRET